jgi:Xaa-Pro aminopeptidase
MDDVRDRLDAIGADALLVGPGADLAHLTGHHALPLERLTMLVLPRRGPATLVVPRLEEPLARAGMARAGTPDGDVVVHAWEETADPLDAVAAVLDGVAPPERAPRVLVGAQVWSAFALGLLARRPALTLEPAGPELGSLRMVKDADGVARLTAAAAAIDAVHLEVPRLLRPGRSEREVARDIAALILAEHDRVNFVIVASGPNGASPHHEPGDRRLELGDAVVVDIGGTLDGHCSDMTRDYVLGRAPDGYDEAHRALEAAQRAGTGAVAPGVRAEDVDRATRAVLDEAGLGEWFVHRTGHGIGLEEHEPPWIVEGDTTVLEPGMTFSVEPGLYLPGRFGMRIEDIVAVTPTGVDVLNRLPREAVTVPVGG